MWGFCYGFLVCSLLALSSRLQRIRCATFAQARVWLQGLRTSLRRTHDGMLIDAVPVGDGPFLIP